MGVKISPCFGASLQTGTKIVAIVHIGFNFLLLWMIILVGQKYGAFQYAISITHRKASFENSTLESQVITNDDENSSETHSSEGISLGLLVIIGGVVAILTSLVLDFILLAGAFQKSAWKCKSWLIVRMTCTVGFIFGFIFGYFEDTAGEFKLFTGPSFFLHVYFLWVVFAFVTEISRDQRKSKVSCDV